MRLAKSNEGHPKRKKPRTPFGRYPGNYRGRIKDFMRDRFFDPDSALCRFGTLHRGYVQLDGTLDPPTCGYVVDVVVNVRNEFGHYGGERTYTFLINNDNIWLIDLCRVKAC